MGGRWCPLLLSLFLSKCPYYPKSPFTGEQQIIGIIIIIVILFSECFTAYFGCQEVAAKVCYLDQEQDHQGKLRWVKPAERVDRCACTSLRPGGVSMMRSHRNEEPEYTDNPMFTDDVEEIKGYFNCPGKVLISHFGRHWQIIVIRHS